MFCPECGTANPDSRFCINCGVEVNSDAVSQPTIVGGAGTETATSGGGSFFKKPINVIAVVGGIVVVAGTIFGVSVALTPNPLVTAVDNCGLNGSDGIELADGDKTLIVDTEGEEDFSGATYDDLDCVIKELNLPERIVNKIDHTSSLDGTVSDTFENISLSWKYHPDNGVNLIASIG